jgi:preprotein translocase subunit SecG
MLTRTTASLGAAFFLTSLILAIIASRSSAPRSVIDGVTQPAQTQPAAPGAPAPGGGVLDQLNRMQQSTPAPPTQN